jgi:hypothetical protein
MPRISGTASGLDPDTTYDFQVRVVNAFGVPGDWSNVAQGTTLPEENKFMVIYTSYSEVYGASSNGGTPGKPIISVETLLTTPNQPTYFTNATIYDVFQFGSWDKNIVNNGTAPNFEQTGVQYCFLDASEAKDTGNPLIAQTTITHQLNGLYYQGSITGSAWAATYDGSWEEAWAALRDLPYNGGAGGTEWDTLRATYGEDVIHQKLLSLGYTLLNISAKSSFSINSTSATKTATWDYPDNPPTIS